MNIELNKVFGDRLKNKRLEKGLTQKELGIKLGISDAAITQYEKGRREPKRELLFKLADILDVSINYFFEGMDEFAEKKEEIIYPDLFTPELSHLAHKFVLEIYPLGFGGIDIHNMTDEQAVAFANIIKKSLRQANDDIELYKFRKRLEEGDKE